MAKGQLSTAEKLASKNPAQRRAGQREAAAMSSSKRSKTVSKAKSISKRGYRGTVSPSEVEGPSEQQVQQASQTISTKTGPSTTAPALEATKTAISPARANLEKAKEYVQVKRYQETQLREKEGVRITSRVYQPESNVVGSGLTTYTAEAGFSRKGRQLASLKPEYIDIEETPQSLQPTKTPLSTAKSRVAGSVPPIDWEGKFGSKLQDDSRPLSFGTQLGRGIKVPAEAGSLVTRFFKAGSKYVKIEPAYAGFTSVVSKEERGLQQSEAVRRAGMETEREMYQERSGVGKFASAWLPGFSAYKSGEYEAKVTTKLVEKGYSTRQAEMGAAALTRERQAGAVGAVGGAVVAELAGELTGQGLVTRALRKTKLIKGSQTAFGMKQLGPSFFVAGAVEGSVQYGVQKGLQGEKVTISGTLGSAALGGAIAAPLGAKIATLPATKAKWAMRGVYAVEPLEYAGDVLGAGILKQAGARTPVTVIVPPTLGGGTIYGTTSPTTASARGRRTTTPSAVVDVTRAPVAAPTTALTASRTAITPAFTPTTVMTPSPLPSPFLMPSFTPTRTISPSTSFTPSTTLLPSVSTTVSVTPSTVITPSPTLTAVEDIPYLDFPGGGGFRRRKRTRRRIITRGPRYKPSLAGLFDPITLTKTPTFVTGIGIRRRVKKKKRGKK